MLDEMSQPPLTLFGVRPVVPRYPPQREARLVVSLEPFMATGKRLAVTTRVRERAQRFERLPHRDRGEHVRTEWVLIVKGGEVLIAPDETVSRICLRLRSLNRLEVWLEPRVVKRHREPRHVELSELHAAQNARSRATASSA